MLNTVQEALLYLDLLCGVDGIANLYFEGCWMALKVTEAKQRQWAGESHVLSGHPGGLPRQSSFWTVHHTIQIGLWGNFKPLEKVFWVDLFFKFFCGYCLDVCLSAKRISLDAQYLVVIFSPKNRIYSSCKRIKNR